MTITAGKGTSVEDTKTTGTAVATRPLEKLKLALSAESVQQQFKNALQENRGQFIASIIDLVGSDKGLQECSPNAVIMECLKAATLKLLINKSLGHAYVIPYKVKGVMTPQFQIGYKGYIQLAMRTGQYKFINAGGVFEGIEVKTDILSGQVKFVGKATSEKLQGYFAYFELLNGFSKTVYMTRDEVVAHAKRFSKSFGSDFSAWKTDFDAMATKTVIRQLLSKYGVLSTEMVEAMDKEVEEEVAQEIADNANKEVIGSASSATTQISPGW